MQPWRACRSQCIYLCNWLHGAQMLERLSAPDQDHAESIRFTYWLQWNLHRQLLRTSRYAASRHVALKGDLPIGKECC